MDAVNTHSTDVKPVDPDLLEQAVPGHGVPSQDPTPAAQVALAPDEAARESKSAFTGGGVMAGSAAGAAVGVAVAGPVGVLVGGTIGAVAGALGGEAAGALVQPDDAGDTASEKANLDGTKDVIPPR